MAMKTEFASAERASAEDLERQRSIFKDSRLILLLDSVTEIVMVLNVHRQIVFANRHALALLKGESVDSLVGLRPGELLSCEHSCAEGGCGTAAACASCGAVTAILSGIQGERKEAECRISSKLDEMLVAQDFKVCASPLVIGGEHFVLFAVNDISGEKRRRALERIFFHDILNTAGGLRSLAKMILEEVPLDLKGESLLMHRFSNDLVDEIMSQRLLLAAESEELSVRSTRASMNTQVQDVVENAQQLDIARDICVDLELPEETVFIETDLTLLRRVMMNMLKNALEASEPGGLVRVRFRTLADGIEFSTANDAVIPDEHKWLIFQRSFSTKGSGRGLGTYSMRLLATNYLKGSVSFESNAADGTEFFLRLPYRLE